MAKQQTEKKEWKMGAHNSGEAVTPLGFLHTHASCPPAHSHQPIFAESILEKSNDILTFYALTTAIA